MLPVSIPVFIGAALIDSINPCAFGVLIFLVAYLLKVSKKPIKVLTHGLTYIGAVFVTYLLAGILLLPVISTLGRISVIAYLVLGAIIIGAGLLEIKDFFWYGRGWSLTLIPGAAERIKIYTKKISGSLSGAAGLGVFVALVELPCTGAVYLAILSLMSLGGVNVASYFWLVIYNLIFVAPLVVILLLVYKGFSVEELEHWRQKHRKLMRLAIGLTLIGLGIWMIFFRLFSVG